MAAGAPTTSGAHVVVGTLRAADLPAARIMRRAGVTLERARTQVDAATPRLPLFLTTCAECQHAVTR